MGNVMKNARSANAVKGIVSSVVIIIITACILSIYLHEEELNILPLVPIPAGHPALELELTADLAFKAFEANFITEEGLIISQYHSDIEGPTISLLESYGQLLEIALLKDDRALFDETWNTTKQFFLAPEGFFYWRIELDTMKPSKVTALIDEFRLLRALLDGFEQFNSSYYQEQAWIVSESIRKYHLRNDRFVNHYELETNNNSSNISLFYIDVIALDHMLDSYPELNKKVANTNRIISKARVNKDGFSPINYNVETGKYQSYEEYNMVELLYISFMRQQLGLSIESFLNFLRMQLANHGAIYNYYDHHGNPTTVDESTAIYALAARLFYNNNDELFYQASLVHMDKFFIRDTEHPLVGLFGDQVNQAVYVYDQLEALKTLYKGVSQ